MIIIFKGKIGCDSDLPHFIGSGYCDDFHNNDACYYDGGDCCDPNANMDYCTLCICHEECDAPMELIGNGVCDDEANNEGCKYDGGDCGKTSGTPSGTTMTPITTSGSGTTTVGGTVYNFLKETCRAELLCIY